MEELPNYWGPCCWYRDKLYGFHVLGLLLVYPLRKVAVSLLDAT